MNSNVKYLLMLPIISVLSCSSSAEHKDVSPVPEVTVSKLASGDVLIYQEYPAKLEGEADVEIRAQVSGSLEKIYVSEGAYVEKGTALFQVDSRTYNEHYNNAEGEMLGAKAGVSAAKLDIEKLKPLVENKVVSEYQLKLAQAKLEEAVAKEKQAYAKVSNAKIVLGFTTVRAPVSGYVGRIDKKNGSLVAPADPSPITYISDNRKIRAYFSIGELDFVNFKQGVDGATISQKLKNFGNVKLILSGGSAYPNPGVLDMVDAAFDGNTGAITLRASFPNREGLLRSGNSGRVRIGVKQAGLITIPQSATFENQDKVFAFIVDRVNKARQVALKVSGSNGNFYYVSQGLSSGDRLVLKGMESLKEGLTVKATPQESVLNNN